MCTYWEGSNRVVGKLWRRIRMNNRINMGISHTWNFWIIKTSQSARKHETHFINKSSWQMKGTYIQHVAAGNYGQANSRSSPNICIAIYTVPNEKVPTHSRLKNKWFMRRRVVRAGYCFQFPFFWQYVSFRIDEDMMRMTVHNTNLTLTMMVICIYRCVAARCGCKLFVISFKSLCNQTCIYARERVFK